MLRSQNRRCEVGIGIMRVFLGIRPGSKTRSRVLADTKKWLVCSERRNSEVHQPAIMPTLAR